jgi:hypothetical protein
MRLVGVVGIENTAERSFKELEGMLGNARALKKNNRERKGILIDPSMAPRFSRCSDSVVLFFSQRTKGLARWSVVANARLGPSQHGPEVTALKHVGLLLRATKTPIWTQ